MASRIQSDYVFQTLSNSSFDSVLDVGCGDGEISVRLCRIGRRVIAIDDDPNRVNKTMARSKSLKCTNMVTYCCSAGKLPFEDNEFDLVVCNSVLEHIKDYKSVLQEIHRVLKPRGRLVVTVPNALVRFGGRFEWFWRLVLKIGKSSRTKLCRNPELGRKKSIPEIRDYFEDYFGHKVTFTVDSLQRDLSFGFHSIRTRQYMQYFGAFLHDLAYYFRVFDYKILLLLALSVTRIEFFFAMNNSGKGICAEFECLK